MQSGSKGRRIVKVHPMQVSSEALDTTGRGSQPLMQLLTPSRDQSSVRKFTQESPSPQVHDLTTENITSIPGLKKTYTTVDHLSNRQYTEEASEASSQNNSSKSFIFRAVFYFIYVILPIITLLSTLICIVSIIVWPQYHNKYTTWAHVMDVSLFISLGMELGYNIGKDIRKSWDYLNFDNLVTSLILAYLCCRFYEYEQNIFAFQLVLRALRVHRLRDITVLVFSNLKKYLIKVQENDLEEEQGSHQYNEKTQVNRFIIESMINFASGIIIESTYFLSFNEYMDFQGWYPCSEDPNDSFDLPTSMYYTIVTFSTIGYGELYPVTWVTRQAVCVAILVNITVLSQFLTKFIELVHGLSPFTKPCKFPDHIVIFGQLHEEWMRDLLEEIVQNDLIQRHLDRQNTMQDGTKILIVTDLDPGDGLRQLALYYTEQHGNEVMFLRDNIFEDGSMWFSKANLKEARVLLGFAWGKSQSTQIQQEYEKLIALMSTKVRDAFSQLRIILVLDLFRTQMERDSLYRGIEVISPLQLNDMLLGATFANSGLSTMLQHLMTLKAKEVSKDLIDACKSDQFMLRYIIDMQQEVYLFKAPNFFIGMTFRECSMILYLYGLNLQRSDSENEDRKLTLLGIETQLNPQPLRYLDKRSITSPLRFMNSSQTKRMRAHSSDDLFTNMLVCPNDYIISHGDVLAVICQDQSQILEALQITSISSPLYQNYAANLIAITNTANRKLTGEVIEQMMDASFQSCQKKSQVFSKVPISTFQVHECNELAGTQIHFKDHYVIFGKNSSYTRAIPIFRKYSEKSLVYFTEGDVDYETWKEMIQSYDDIYLLRGQFLNYKHLALLNLGEAINIMIQTELLPLSNPDAIGICLANILMSEYGRNEFLMELKDENQIAFLRKNPRFGSIDCPNFFYPSFVSGSIYFQSFVTTIVARQVYQKTWLQLIKAFQRDDNKKVMHNVKVTRMAVQVFSCFGEMQLAFMEHSPSLLVLGMVKNQYNSRQKRWEIEKFINQEINRFIGPDNNKNQEQTRQEVVKQVESIYAKILGDRFVITNPSFFTPIEENDTLIVLGLCQEKYDPMLDYVFPPQINLNPPEESNQIDLDKLLEELEPSALLSINQEQTHKEAQKRIEMKNDLIEELSRTYSTRLNFFTKYK